ncbi:hypothetical protein CerSpe_219000 [Prunus speciosa]
MDSNHQKLHIAMFPWLAFGHMIPYLELAKLIAQKGHQISFISTPRNIERLPQLPLNLSSLITLIKLPFPRVDDDLPKAAEATIDIPQNKVMKLKKAYDALQQPLTHFLQSSNPDWLLFDFVPYWAPTIAHNLGIPCAFFSIFIGACLAFAGPTSPKKYPDDRKNPEDYTVSPKWIPFPSNVAFHLFEVRRIYDQSMVGDETNVSDVYRFMEGMKSCDVIAVRSCIEFEPEWLRLLQDIHQKTVLPVGQLPTTNNDENDQWGSISKWLDMQLKGSVVYVAFGSEAMPSQEEITTIARGLEQSELPFIWVFRSNLVKLPEGFEERIGERGVVCKSWAPQLKILGHDSVGVFLSHSGWSSVVEALTFGRPLVLLTMSNDQGLNARLLEERKIGYSIPRDEKDGSFTSDWVAESLKLVVKMDEGKIYRDKAKELKPLFGDRKKQDTYVHNFLEYLKAHGRSASKKV